MKKIITAVLMILLILGFSLGAEYLLYGGDNNLNITVLDQLGQEENPCPVDVEALADLDMEPFISNLPVLMIDTREQQIVKEEMRTVSVAVYDDVREKNDIMGNPTKVLTAGLKLRGASSYNFDKNQYRMKFFRDEGGKALSYGLFGMAPDSEWVLHGPFLDHSLLRNYLMYTLSREIMDWAPDCRFMELFVDGHYQGVYLAVAPERRPNSLRPSRLGPAVTGSTAR